MKENEKLEMILVEDDEVLELEEIYDDTFPAVENISNNSDILKNEEKFLQLLYFLNKKEDIVNLLKRKFYGEVEKQKVDLLKNLSIEDLEMEIKKSSVMIIRYMSFIFVIFLKNIIVEVIMKKYI